MGKFITRYIYSNLRVERIVYIGYIVALIILITREPLNRVVKVEYFKKKTTYCKKKNETHLIDFNMSS